MKKAIGLIFIDFLLLGGCVKESKWPFDGPWIDENYPTTYHQMPTSVLNTLKKEYLKDSCFQSSINTFGFCASSDNYNFNCIQCCLAFNQEKAHDMVMDFLQKNKKFTGVLDTSLVKITSYQAFGKSYLCNTQDSSLWNVSIGKQVINGLEIESTEIYFRLNYYGATEVIGNWYPIVNIPEKEAISYDMAKTRLLGKHYDFICWSMIHLKINQDTQWSEPEKRKLIYPFYRNNSIELHVVWVLQTGFFSFYVDEISGEVLNSFMNVVCLVWKQKSPNISVEA